jgi:hypothetical protein
MGTEKVMAVLWAFPKAVGLFDTSSRSDRVIYIPLGNDVDIETQLAQLPISDRYRDDATKFL